MCDTSDGVTCFYSQADDVRQVYAFGSFHSVLALAQMCKPAAKETKEKKRKKNTHKMKNNCNVCENTTHISRCIVLLSSPSPEERLTRGYCVSHLYRTLKILRSTCQFFNSNSQSSTRLLRSPMLRAHHRRISNFPRRLFFSLANTQ